MKLSNAAFSVGTLLGLPAFFMKVGGLPVAAQVGLLVAIFCCGIVGVALWAFEHADRNSEL
jgi:hypothetical protein